MLPASSRGKEGLSSIKGKGQNGFLSSAGRSCLSGMRGSYFLSEVSRNRYLLNLFYFIFISINLHSFKDTSNNMSICELKGHNL